MYLLGFFVFVRLCQGKLFSYLLQCLTVAVQRGSAVFVMGTFYTENCLGFDTVHRHILPYLCKLCLCACSVNIIILKPSHVCFKKETKHFEFYKWSECVISCFLVPFSYVFFILFLGTGFKDCFRSSIAVMGHWCLRHKHQTIKLPPIIARHTDSQVKPHPAGSLEVTVASFTLGSLITWDHTLPSYYSQGHVGEPHSHAPYGWHTSCIL